VVRPAGFQPAYTGSNPVSSIKDYMVSNGLIVFIFVMFFFSFILNVAGLSICFYMIVSITIQQAREEMVRKSFAEKERRRKIREERFIRKQIESFEFI
jgi:uncharacterized membrane protein YedE/YeeE